MKKPLLEYSKEITGVDIYLPTETIYCDIKHKDIASILISPYGNPEIHFTDGNISTYKNTPYCLREKKVNK